MDKQTVLNMVEMVKSGITDSIPNIDGDINWEFIYQVAQMHNVVPLLYSAIVNSGKKLPPETEQKFFEKTCIAVSVCAKQRAELEKLFGLFEASHIDYMPLKGTVIRDIYPKQEFRMMGDADILIREGQYKKIKQILENEGFLFVKDTQNEHTWKKGALCLELHKYLISPYHTDYFEFFGDGWQFAIREDDASCRYIMKTEDFYAYLIVHFAKHYRRAGIGIRHITDIWVYIVKNPDMDMQYVTSQLSKIKLEVFHKNLLKTVDVWFKDGKPDEITDLITRKILSSGTFGTSASVSKSDALKEQKAQGKKIGRMKKLIYTIFPSFSMMRSMFPILEKIPVLLPILWIYRIAKRMFCNLDYVKKQLENIKSLTDENLSKYEQELKAVGLDFSFKE